MFADPNGGYVGTKQGYGAEFAADLIAFDGVFDLDFVRYPNDLHNPLQFFNIQTSGPHRRIRKGLLKSTIAKQRLFLFLGLFPSREIQSPTCGQDSNLNTLRISSVKLAGSTTLTAAAISLSGIRLTCEIPKLSDRLIPSNH